MYDFNMESNDKYKEIGGRIKEAREKEGVTQAELAKALGYGSPTFISLIEAGERKVRIDDLEGIAEVLHRDVQLFISGKSSIERPNLKMALRADNDLDEDDVKKVESLVDALKIIKKQQNGRRSKSL
jgi:transcriptional regulator with XRE-family HTH domain